jgi:hypothetical protein
MRVSTENGDFLELERFGAEVDASDIRLVVRVRFHAFAAEIEAWVLRAAWLVFPQELAVLERRRQGEAKLQGMSPDELSIVVRSIDRAGHMGVEGIVGALRHNYSASLRLAALAFDPSQLPAFVHDAQEIASP